MPSESSFSQPTPTPWHLWPVGLLALLWHIGGALDYVLTQIAYAPYVGQFPPEWAAYFDAIPAWVTGAWAIGVWVGLLGAVLLLMRDRNAVMALAVAFVAMVVATIWLVFISQPTMQSVTGAAGLYTMFGASAAALFLWLYARWLKIRGVFDG